MGCKDIRLYAIRIMPCLKMSMKNSLTVLFLFLKRCFLFSLSCAFMSTVLCARNCFDLHVFLLIKWICSDRPVVLRVTKDCRLRSRSCTPVVSIQCASICGSSTCGYLSSFISVRKSKVGFLLCWASMRLQMFQYMHVPFCYVCRLTFCPPPFSLFCSVPWHSTFLLCSPSIIFILSNKLWKVAWRWNVLAHILAHGCVCIIFCSRKFLFLPCKSTFYAHHSGIFHTSLSGEEPTVLVRLKSFVEPYQSLSGFTKDVDLDNSSWSSCSKALVRVLHHCSILHT